MVDELFTEVVPYAPFDQPECVAAVLADGLINYALVIARKDRSLAIEALKKVLPHIRRMMSDLDFTEDDYNRVSDLMEKAQALLIEGDTALLPIPNASLH